MPITPEQNIFARKKAMRLAKIAGWPDNKPDHGRVAWQIAPGDNAIYAFIEMNDSELKIELTLNYIGKNLLMLRCRYDIEKDSITSDGLLFPGDAEMAAQCFKEHTSSMMCSVFMRNEARRVA